jgi:hypothetical protein
MPHPRHIARASRLLRLDRVGANAYRTVLLAPTGSGAHVPLCEPVPRVVAEVVGERVVEWLAAEFEAVEREALVRAVATEEV